MRSTLSSKAVLSAMTAAALFAALESRAGAVKGAATIPDQACATSEDPAETASRIGPDSVQLRGRCVDTARFRPVVDLRTDTTNTSVTFKNYVYKGQFWTATVPTGAGAIGDVLFEVKRFSVAGGLSGVPFVSSAVNAVKPAHTQLRFKMSSKIKLVNQTSGETAETDDLAITFEAGLVKDVPFNIALAVLPQSPLVGRAGETASIMTESPKPMEQYVLALDEEEKQMLMTAGLRRSQQIGLGVYYNTIAPNCTTEIFDLLDTLPRLKGKIERFAVVLSLDPVAGPSIDALQTRKLISKRVQNFEDELKGVKAELRIPETAQTLPSFIPAVSGHPWSLVIVSPDLNTLRESEKLAIAELKKELLGNTFKVLQGFTAGKLLEQGMNDQLATSILSSVILASQSELSDIFTRFRAKMSDDDHMIAVYLAPVAGVPASTSLAKFGLNLAVPFPVIDEKYTMGSLGELPIFRKIYEGSVAVAERGLNSNVPAYLLGTGIILHASKKVSNLSLQTMVGLSPRYQKLERADKQVNLHRFDIPDVAYPQLAPVAVVSSTIALPLAAKMHPWIRIEFGPVGKITEFDDRTKIAGLMRPWSPVAGQPEAHGKTSHEICQVRANVTPTIVGNLSSSASGVAVVDQIIEGSPIFFRIQSVTVDLKSLAVSEMDIRSDLPPLYCLTMEDINQKFRDNANGDATKLKNKIVNFVQNPFVELVKVLGF